MTTEEKIGTLEDEALKRKERLKTLKRKCEDPSTGASGNVEVTLQSLPKPKFRSYQPSDEKLKEGLLALAKPGDVEAEVKEQLEAANTRVVIEDLDLTSLAPRKPDWDLKRDVAKKLERLEKRTQRAIADLIRERLKSGQNDMATCVAIGAQSNRLDVDED